MMSSPLSDEERATLRALHREVPAPPFTNRCAQCSEPWPCTVDRLLTDRIALTERVATRTSQVNALTIANNALGERLAERGTDPPLCEGIEPTDDEVRNVEFDMETGEPQFKRRHCASCQGRDEASRG